MRWPLQPLQPLQKNTAPTTFRSISPSVDSLCHPWFTATNLSYRFPIFETSATALCGTTGILLYLFCQAWVITVGINYPEIATPIEENDDHRNGGSRIWENPKSYKKHQTNPFPASLPGSFLTVRWCHCWVERSWGSLLPCPCAVF